MEIKIQGLFVKVLGRGGKKIYVSSYDEFVQAINQLIKLNKLLTFAFELEHGHHCTISFIGKCNHPKFYLEAQNFFNVLLDNKFTKFQIIKKEKFNSKTNVIILSIGTKEIYDEFQKMSQVGLREGNSDIRIHHMTYFLDGDLEKINWLTNILSKL